MFLAIILSLIALLLNGRVSLNFLVIVFFCVCVSYPIDTIIKSAFKVNIILIIFMFILIKLNIANNIVYVSTMGRLRCTLGFENPNAAALFYSSAIYLFLVSGKKIKKISIVLSFIATVILYYYTNTRTLLMALLIFIVLESLFLDLEQEKNLRKMQTLMSKFLSIFVDMLFIFNIASVFMIEKFMRLDSLLSFRISFLSKMINHCGLREFLFGGTTEAVDSFYYMLLFQYGVFVYIFVAILNHIAIKKMIDKKKFKYIPLLVSLFLVGIMESSLLRPEVLVVLITWKLIFLI